MQRKKAPVFKTTPRVELDLDEDFSDVDGDPNVEFVLPAEVENSDRRPVWVHNDPDSIREYRNHVLKYEPVVDGKGESIMARDHVLYSCDRGKFEKRERYKRVNELKQRAMILSKENMQGEVDLGDERVRQQIAARLEKVTTKLQSGRV